MTAFLSRFCALFFFAFLLAGPGTLRAVEVSGLYEAVVPVANQGAAERMRATREGFRQVLVKASGQRSVLANAAIQPELGKAETLLGSFRYETIPAVRPGSPDASAMAYRVRLKFDPASVRGVLNRIGAPVWSPNRPQVSVWIMREGAVRTLYTVGTPQGDVLLDAAFARGLAVSLPAPGESLPQDGSVGMPIAMKDTSGRVDARVVLAAAISSSANRLRGLGTLLVEGVEQRLDVSGSDEAEVLRELLAQAADQLGAKYGVVVKQEQIGLVRLRVEGVRSLAGYAGLERWLQSQPLLKDVVTTRIEGDATVYTVTLAGDIERLLTAMRADGRFASIDAPVADGSVINLRAVLAAAPIP